MLSNLPKVTHWELELGHTSRQSGARVPVPNHFTAGIVCALLTSESQHPPHCLAVRRA